MKATHLHTDKENKRQYWRVTNNGERLIFIVSLTDVPFWGVSDVEAIYNEEYQNKPIECTNQTQAEMYATILGESVKYL